MASKLTNEQMADMQAHVDQPMPMENETGQVVGFFVTMAALDNLEQLRQMMKRADASADVPADEAHQRIRKMAQEATKKYA